MFANHSLAAILIVGFVAGFAQADEVVLPTGSTVPNSEIESRLEAKINQSLNGAWQATVLWNADKTATVVLSANQNSSDATISYHQAEHVVRTMLPKPAEGGAHKVIPSGDEIEAPVGGSIAGMFLQLLVIVTSVVIMTLSYLGAQYLWKLRDTQVTATSTERIETTSTQHETFSIDHADAA